MAALIDLFGTEDDPLETMPEILPPEAEEGNVEYKLKLVDPSESRFEHLVTQMKWRLQEGGGEAIYEIGVEDNGNLAGLDDTDLEASLNTLQSMAKRLGASTSVLRERVIDGARPRRRAAEILVRRVADDQQFIDLRMAVLGNVDAGKSTLLGVMTQSELDNGRGRARLNLFRHLHEIQTGRTSSISHEILGFNDKGEVVNYSCCSDAEEICDQSSKLITLIDLAGHHKYLKTTIFGLTSYSPHFAMLVVAASSGAVGTTKEHLGFALALGVPIFVVVTKTDLVRKAVVNRTVEQLEKILVSPGCKKVPMRIHDEDEAITAATNFSAKSKEPDTTECMIVAHSVTPIFSLSSVTGENMHLLLKFLNALPPLHITSERDQLVQEHTEMKIDMVYTVPDVGTVVGGHVSSGLIRENDQLLLGPSAEGLFLPVVTHSIQRSKLTCRLVQAGQACTLALQNHDHLHVRKGQVLVSERRRPVSCMSFDAEIFLLFHVNSISEGFQTTVHIGNVCQTAFIEWMDKDNIQTSQRASVRFRFIKQPEYIKQGSRLLFREGRTKGMGEVTRIHPYEHVSR